MLIYLLFFFYTLDWGGGEKRGENFTFGPLLFLPLLKRTIHSPPWAEWGRGGEEREWMILPTSEFKPETSYPESTVLIIRWSCHLHTLQPRLRWIFFHVHTWPPYTKAMPEVNIFPCSHMASISHAWGKYFSMFTHGLHTLKPCLRWIFFHVHTWPPYTAWGEYFSMFTNGLHTLKPCLRWIFFHVHTGPPYTTAVPEVNIFPCSHTASICYSRAWGEYFSMITHRLHILQPYLR